MVTYKIGAYYYKEISEEEYCDLRDKGGILIYALIDSDGFPIKFFKKGRKIQ